MAPIIRNHGVEDGVRRPALVQAVHRHQVRGDEARVWGQGYTEAGRGGLVEGPLVDDPRRLLLPSPTPPPRGWGGDTNKIFKARVFCLFCVAWEQHVNIQQ